MEERELKRLRDIASKATPGPWGSDWGINYPFYTDVRKPAPSLSKHDSDRPTYWRMEDGVFASVFNPSLVLKLLDHLEYWINDSAAAWDKCEERRQEGKKHKAQLDIAEKALNQIRECSGEDAAKDDFKFRLRTLKISREALEKIKEEDKNSCFLNKKEA